MDDKTRQIRAAEAPSLPRIDSVWEENLREREFRLREAQFALRQEIWRRLRGLVPLAGAFLTVTLIVVLVNGGLLVGGYALRQRQHELSEARLALERQRFEQELIAQYVTIAPPEQRARNLALLIKQGLLPASAAERANAVPPPPQAPPPAALLEAPGPSKTPTLPALVPPPQVQVEERTTPSRPLTWREAQRVLEARGYFRGEVDGRYDENTKAAVARFQREQGLTEDSLLGPETIRAIQRLEQTAPPGSSAGRRP